jgi:SAM-dependent methyltransferase
MTEIEELQETISTALYGRDSLTVLEAGCGSTSHITLPKGARVIGIDISERQLARNLGLSEAILGDVQSHKWPANSFDLVLCWDVLEHLPSPKDAIARMVEGLRPGGLIVLALPNLLSLKGLVTKFTPYGFHAAFYRYVIGDKRASTAWDQFPTFLKYDCAPTAIRRQAIHAGLIVLHYKLYEGPVQVHLRRKYTLANWAFKLLGAFSMVLSLGKINLAHSDSMIVLQRPLS